MKKLITSIWLLVLASIIGLLFWYNDLVYQLPTPFPVGYKPTKIGSKIDLGFQQKIKEGAVSLHFYNPACPCSRFNVAAVRRLYRQFGSQFSFVIVVISNKKYTSQEIRNRFDIPVTVVFDRSIAEKCGVYATPQLVILTAKGELYYRGNYNQSRYCTSNKTNYARIAMQNLLYGQQQIFDRLALRAYGCQLPDCTL